MRLFPTQPVVVPLAQAPALAIANLQAATQHSGIGQFFKDRITGSVTPERIVLRSRRVWWRNDAAPVFDGRISEDGRSIVGVFRLPLFTRVFLAAWSLLILVLFLPTEVTGIFSDGLTSQHLETITILALMLAFGVTFSWLGWFLGRSDMKKITDLLQDAARRVNGREDR